MKIGGFCFFRIPNHTLRGTRTVILSRWDKPIRIVPDSEVADVIIDMFEGRNITMPSNVVTPSLRRELEKRGILFIETDKQGKEIRQPYLSTNEDDLQIKDRIQFRKKKILPSTLTLANLIRMLAPEVLVKVRIIAIPQP